MPSMLAVGMPSAELTVKLLSLPLTTAKLSALSPSVEFERMGYSIEYQPFDSAF